MRLAFLAAALALASAACVTDDPSAADTELLLDEEAALDSDRGWNPRLTDDELDALEPYTARPFHTGAIPALRNNGDKTCVHCHLDENLTAGPRAPSLADPDRQFFPGNVAGHP